MATLREIRNRISSVKSTQQITKAMKMVAAARLRRAQENILAFRPYAYNLDRMIGHLIAVSQDDLGIPLMEKRPVKRVLTVVVTADRGLCGAFNSNIIRRAAQQLKGSNDSDITLYMAGRKGMEFFRRRDVPVEGSKVNFFNDLDFEDALELSRTLISLYESKKYDRIEIVYNEFKSAIQQNLRVEQFLPFEADEEIEKQEGLIDFIFEPDLKSILNQVIPRQLNVQIWRILLESNAAEQGARMTAMESATDNAQEMIEDLTIFYNRSRQAAITTEISEIVSGAEALKES